MAQSLDAETIKERQRQDWRRAAPGWKKWDAYFSTTTAPVTQRLLELAGLVSGQRVLDIACGTGQPALPAAERVGPSGWVLGLDLSEDMLKVAQEKAQARGLSNLEFRLGDAEATDFEPESFDVVLCRWGLMLMPEPLRCLQHAQRALKSGGRIALSVWGPRERNPWFTVPVDILGRYVEVPTPQPGAPGPFALADDQRLAATLSEAGFREVNIEPLELVMAAFDSGQQYWDFMREVSSTVAPMLEKLAANAREAVATEIADAASQGSPEGTVSLTGYTLLASARK